jgi:hypothetical protein
MKNWIVIALGLSLFAPASLQADRAASLRGSPAAMQEQNRVARDHGPSFYRTPAEIRAAAARGDLVELRGGEDYAVADFVRFPYLHPDAALFVERLAKQYREACGQRLVVTSAVRPSNGQPSNAHALSVHPAGMAVDLRVSDRASCRSWLEGTLLNLERQGLLNGIREFRPPHYHVAVFPRQYREYAEGRIALEEAAAEEAAREVAESVLATLATGGSALVEAGGAVSDATEGGPDRPRRLPLFVLTAVLLGVPAGIGFALRRSR